MSEKDGGPAFPSVDAVQVAEETREIDQYRISYGMTLRDYFAAAAFQARLTLKDGRTRDERISDAYDDADAMLKEREKA